MMSNLIGPLKNGWMCVISSLQNRRAQLLYNLITLELLWVINKLIYNNTFILAGLANLSIDELQTMADEMRSKFNRLSLDLINSLEERDILIGQLDVKNCFVGALLRVSKAKRGLDANKVWYYMYVCIHQLYVSLQYLLSVLPYNRPDRLQWTIELLTILTHSKSCDTHHMSCDVTHDLVLQAISDECDQVPSLVSNYIQQHSM